jgi:hypothetical protein
MKMVFFGVWGVYLHIKMANNFRPHTATLPLPPCHTATLPLPLPLPINHQPCVSPSILVQFPPFFPHCHPHPLPLPLPLPPCHCHCHCHCQTTTQSTATATADPQKAVQTGVFGAEMAVSLINDGPITMNLDSRRWS